MKKVILFILVFVAFTSTTDAQNWTKDQLTKASTASHITYLSKVETETIMYVNLARLYPKDFAKIELGQTEGLSPSEKKYQASLVKKLNSMNALKPLYFDESLYEFAKCFAKESGEKGIVGHKRKKCKGGYFAECCSYGMYSGRDIVLQLLIDSDVPSLGHRKICLSENYSKIGVSVHDHKKYGTCAVLDII